MESLITEDQFLEYMALDFPTFKIAKCNFTYPTSDFVISFYMAMIEAVTCIKDADRLWSLTEKQNTEIQLNPNEGNSFLQHIYSRNLHAAVKYIFSQVNPNMPEFKYSDILLPENTPRRTFIFMSFMLHFFYSYVGFGDDLSEDLTALEEKATEMRSMKDYKMKLLNQLKEFEDQKTEHAEALKIAKANILKYSTLNNEKENILKELHSKDELLEVESRKIEERENSLQEELIRLENDIKYYESLIVSNPDEVAEMHANHEMKKIQCRSKMKALEEAVATASVKLSTLNGVTEQLQILNNIIRNDHCNDSDKMNFKELQKSISNLNAKLLEVKKSECGLTNKLTEKEMIISKLKSDMMQLESDQATIISKGDEKCRMYTDSFEDREKLFTQMSIKMRKDEEEAKEVNSEIADLTEKCGNLELKIKNIDSENKQKYFWCSNQIKVAFNNIREALTN